MIDINLNLPIDTTPTDGSTNLIDSNAVFDGLATKQETLVSATNIKTINGTSVLGSGDLVVSGGSGVSGINIVVKPKSGVYYSTNPLSGTGGTTTTASNFLYLAPFIPLNSISVDEFKLEVNVLASGGLATILIFDDLNGLPNNKLIESTNLDCSTLGIKTYTAKYSFTAGSTYWIGVSVNAAIGFRSNNNSFALQHHPSTSAVVLQFAKSNTFGSTPSVISINPITEISSSQPITIRFRQV